MSGENNNQALVSSAISVDEETKITEMIANMRLGYDSILIEPATFLRQALLAALRRDPSAFDAMLTVYKGAFVYDGIHINTGLGSKNNFIDYFDIHLPLSENSVPKLTDALYAIARVTQRCVNEIAHTGGQTFASQYGNSIDIKAIFEGIKKHMEAGHSFDPSPSGMRIRFTGSMIFPVFLSPPAVQPVITVSPEPDAGSSTGQMPADISSEEEGKITEMANMAFPYSIREEATLIRQALLDVLRRNPSAYDAMLTAYRGNFVHDTIHIDAGTDKFFPEYFDIKFPLAGNIVPKLTNALYTMALAAQHCIREITQAGGGEEFAKKHGRTLKIKGIFEGIQQHLEKGEPFDPFLLQFELNGTDLAPVFLPRPADTLVNISPEIPQESQLENYRVVVPDDVRGRVAVDADTPADVDGKRYIRIEDHVYQVSFDEQRDAWCIRSDDTTQVPLAVHYQDKKWQLRAIGYLAPPPADGTTNYRFLSQMTRDELRTYQSGTIAEQINPLIDRLNNLITALSKAFTARGMTFTAPQDTLSFTAQLAVVNTEITRYSGNQRDFRKQHDNLRKDYNKFDASYAPDIVDAWRVYRTQEAIAVPQMANFDPVSRNRVQIHLETNTTHNGTGIGSTGDISGAHMKDHFLAAVGRHRAKILGYRTYVHAPGIVQVSYLMPGDPGYLDTVPPASNGLAAPPADAVAGRGANAVPARIAQDEPIHQAHPAWHIYDAGGPYAPAHSPAAGTVSLANPRLKTIFDPGMAGSIVTTIDQYMGYVDEVMGVLDTGPDQIDPATNTRVRGRHLLRHEHLRYNVPVPSLSGRPGGDIRLVVYFSRIPQPGSINDVRMKLATAFINANSPALAAAYTDVVSDGFPVVNPLPGPGDLGNELLRNAEHLHNFVGAIRTAAAAPAADGTDRWIYQLDTGASQSARELFFQDPHRSELILWNAPADKRNSSLKWNGQSLVVGEVPVTAAENSLKLTVVVSPITAGQNTDTLRENFRKLAENLKGFSHKTQITIELVGCNTEMMNSPDSELVRQLANELLPLWNRDPALRKNLTFTTRQYAQRQAAGGGQEVYVPGRGWITDADIVRDNEKYRSDWRYDKDHQVMVAAVPPHRLNAFRNLVERLYRGPDTFSIFTAEEKQLVLCFLTRQKIQQLSGAQTSNNAVGQRLYKVTTTLTEQYAGNAEGIFDGRATFTELERAEAARDLAYQRVPLNAKILAGIVSMFSKIKPWTALGGSVQPGLEQWGWNEADLKKFARAIKKKVTTPAALQDTGETRWVVQMQGDATTSDAARALFLNHPGNSELIPWNPNKAASDRNSGLRWDNAKQSLVSGTVPPPAGRLNILLVGHGPDGRSDEGSVFGGRHADVIKQDFAKMLADISPGSVSRIDITLMGCRLVDITASENSLPKQLADMLLARGKELRIPVESLSISAFQSYVRVMPNGLEETYIRGRGWFTPQEVAGTGAQHKSVWRYDNNAKSMLSDMPFVRFHELRHSLWRGQISFEELSDADKSLVLDYLDRDQINTLCGRGRDGGVMNQALQGMAAKFAGTTEGIRGIPDGRAVVGSLLDTEDKYWRELGETVAVSPDAGEDAAAGKIIVSNMNRQQDPREDTPVPSDSYTRRSMGFRARVLSKLQAVIGPTSKGVLALGAVAAISRIKIIDERLKREILSTADRADLEAEKALAYTELGVDLSDEAIGLVNSAKLDVHVTRAFKGTHGLKGPAISMGSRVTSGIRVFAGVTGSVLSAVGTGLAWYGVHTALKERSTLEALHQKASGREKAELQGKLAQLQVNLGVNIATAIVSTVLTAGTVAVVVSSIAAGLGVAAAGAALKVIGPLMAWAGPIGGAILVGAFVGLWIYNGIKTVQEFSQYMELNGWDQFELGFGSIFGSVPARLQTAYDAGKLKAALAEAAQQERQATFGSQPEIKTLYQFHPEVVPGKIHTEPRYVAYSVGGMPGGSYVSSERVDPPTTYQRAIDIDMDRKQYVAISSAGQQVQLNPDEFISVRQTREVRDAVSQDGVLLNLPVRTVDLPASIWGKKTSGATISEKLSGKIHETLLSILRGQPDAKLFAADEENHLALFCIHQNSSKISFYKYRRQKDGSYSTDVSWTQPLPAGLQLPQRGLLGSGIFFQDLNGDGLADLVVVNENGQLQVARQQQDGSFVLTEEFSVYRAKANNGERESLSFSGHRILGFGDTARTLYSLDNSSGVTYAYTIVSSAESQSDVSLVKLNAGESPSNKPSGKNAKPDKFIASAKAEAGDFVFHLGGGRKKEVKGSINKDSFLLLDDKTQCVLDGNEGTDTLDFSQLNVHGVVVNAPKGEASIKPKKGSARRKIVSFSNMENFTGTRGNDELTGDGANNVIDGAGGRDTIDTGAGDDVLRGIQGTFKGGAGTDRYQLGRVPTVGSTVVTATDLIEDYSKGEDSYVSLEYRIDEIKSMTPEGVHLLITLNDGVQYRLHHFYANAHAGPDKKTSTWYFTTRDGFSFHMKTTVKPPASKEALSGIVVSFDGTQKEEGGLTNIRFHAKGETAGARIELSEQVAGKNVAREITLPAMFNLELRSVTRKDGVNEVNGSDLPELLTGSAGTLMKGKGGADTYLIEDSKGGVVEIDNSDARLFYLSEQDTLILPWQLSETKLVVKGNDLHLSHVSEPENHVEIRLSGFMSSTYSRHLDVCDPLGQMHSLHVNGSMAYLASGQMTMKHEDRLEVFSASQQYLTLDGSSRILTENSPSTVIIDHSALGNTLQGTEGARNYLQVFGGINILSGGQMADVFLGGTGKDYMEGKAGNDVYYVQGKASIKDTAGEDTLVLMAAQGTAQEQLEFEKKEGDLLIRFRNDTTRKVTVEGYYDKPGQKIEHIVMNDARLSGADIDNLVSAMAAMRVQTPESDTWQKREALTEALGKWTSLAASPVASSV